VRVDGGVSVGRAVEVKVAGTSLGAGVVVGEAGAVEAQAWASRATNIPTRAMS
jgi:hypothetical protein